MAKEPRIAEQKNPDWTRDEMLLALDYYFRHRGRPMNPNSPEMAALSAQVKMVAAALGLSGNDRFRNSAGVSMKIENFKSHDPNLKKLGRRGLPKGNKLEKSLLEEFEDRADDLRKIAAAIVAAAASGTVASLPIESDADDFEAPEGRLLARLHLRRERNRELVKRKKAAAMRDTGRLSCEVCDFDFLAAYGERGRGFIECHHTVPVSSLGEGGRTSVKDLALVCANCHRMIHAGRPWWSIEEARAVLAKHR